MELQVARPRSNKATVSWAAVPHVSTYCVMVKDSQILQSEWTFYVEGAAKGIALPIPLQPGHTYQVVLKAQKMRFREGRVVYQTIRQSSTKFRAEFTKDEQRTLYDRAISYVNQGKPNTFEPIESLYRNKPEEYWDYIHSHKSDVMEVYLKDDNGDPASIINGKVNGLFFATNLDRTTMKPPSTSNFGTKRLYLPAAVLMGDDSVHLYFADFYCNFRAHYVTVVMATKDSETDRFCAEKLIRLELYDNAFLFKRYPQVFVSKRVHVEVLYTENVDIRQWIKEHNAHFDRVEVSKGTSTPGGLPKNPKCPTCNLYGPRDDSDDDIN